MNTLLFIFLFLVVFPLFWLGVTYLLALVSGWRAMVKYYHTEEQFEGITQKRVSGNIGWVGYNHILTVTLNKEGLYLSTNVLFRFVNPPLFIPWKHIELLGKSQILWFSRQKLIVNTPLGNRISKLSLPRNIFEEAEQLIPHNINGNI